MRDDASLEQRLEAMLTVALEPISAEELADVAEADAEDVVAVLGNLRTQFVEEKRGFQLAELASGWVMQSSPDVSSWVTKFASRDVSHRLSSAALETLAVVAYRQPVSRARVSAVRGVNVDGVMRTLVTRGLVEESGTEGESGSILYRTTSYFLERLGLTTIEDLPDLAPYLPEIESLDPEAFLSSS